MPLRCHVPDCIVYENNKDYKLFRIPVIDVRAVGAHRKLLEIRRKQWIRNCQLRAFPADYHRVCGRHFVSGKAAHVNDIKNIDWVPTVNLPPARTECSAVTKGINGTRNAESATCSSGAGNGKENNHCADGLDLRPVPLNCSRSLQYEMGNSSERWLKACGCLPKANMRICGKHFVKGEPADLETTDDIDWVPTLFLPGNGNVAKFASASTAAEIASAHNEYTEAVVSTEFPAEHGDDGFEGDSFVENSLEIIPSSDYQSAPIGNDRNQNMVILCAVQTCRNHNKNCDLSFYTFPLPRKYSTKEHEKLLAMRLAMWRKACRYTKPINRSVRICGKHFVSGKPSNLDDPSNVDWVPSLYLPKQPPSAVQGAEAEAVEPTNKPDVEKRTVTVTICSMKHCESNTRPSWKTKIFPFPKLDTTNYVKRVLSEKRLMIWLELSDQSTSWDKVDIFKLQLCSLHFATGSMADLMDVESVDWIPTVNMNKRICFSNHVAHFDLYNLISLVKDSRMTQNCMTIDDFSLPKASAGANVKTAEKTAEPVILPDRPKVCVGLKCILCLSTSMLKPLKPEQRQAIDVLFKDKLRVESELICGNCSKSVSDFFTFYKSIVSNQEKATMRKLKNVFSDPENAKKRPAPAPLAAVPVDKQMNKVVPVPGSCLKRLAPAPPPAAPVEKKMKPADGKAGKLFELLTTNEFQCKLCRATLATKPALNDHLFLAHKVKISCKLCKMSFSPDGYAKHKTACLAKIKAKRQAQKAVANVAVPSSANVSPPKPVVPPPSNVKHSCYICKEFYTPEEMIAHIKTHGIDTTIKQDIIKDYEICKLCKKAIQKQNMDRHMEAHESHRNQLRKLIQEQQDKQRFQCSECLLEFRTIALLEKHKTKHKLVSQDDRIECPDCSRVMTAKYYKFHVQLVHDNDLLPCEKCGKQFSRAALKKHRSTTCGDDGMATCEHCGKMMREYLLKGHVSKVHSTTTVKCSFCSKEFDSKEYANSHERWSHREEWDKRKREGVKRLDLDREQLEEALGIKTNPNEDEDSSTCPVCFNFHGTKAGVEQHVRKAHYTEYMSMVMGGVIVSTGDNALEDFNAAEYLTEVLQAEGDTDAI